MIDPCLNELPLFADCPSLFTCPFDYVPHSLCKYAAKLLQQRLSEATIWHRELAEGKMFGVLVVRDEQKRLWWIASFSGQLGGSFHAEGFVPPIFDYLQPDGYFRREEKKISLLNKRIQILENSPALLLERKRLELFRSQMDHSLELMKERMKSAKRERDKNRASPDCSEEERKNLVRESQFMRAEYRRSRARLSRELSAYENRLAQSERAVELLKNQRKIMSESLQQWLFSHFVVSSSKGLSQDLLTIFEASSKVLPPSGAGECCAPKLLHYAFTHQLEPICMAEFWWGKSPINTIRRHLHYYPACMDKCKPILMFMMEGMNVEKPLHHAVVPAAPRIIYEDEYIAVVSKPSGMLSVAGKNGSSSVTAFLSKKWKEKNAPWMVHRLDQDASGLLLVAKNLDCYRALQRQFFHREIRKRYVALLEAKIPSSLPAWGVISIPIAPDHMHRPSQKVDFEKGKDSVTIYRVITQDKKRCRVALRPCTGRTHQLRLHCAHPLGLGTPILGDTLYGSPEKRLYLHAERLIFRHPYTGKRMIFEEKAPF